MGNEVNVTYDWKQIVKDLNDLLRLRSIPVGMKLYSTKEEMEAVPRIRRPKKRHLLDQIVAQSVRLGFTIGVTADDLAMKQCGAIAGLMSQDDEWLKGEPMAGVWFDTEEDAAKHQQSLDVVPYGKYEALAISPLEANRIKDPDICYFLWYTWSNDHFHQRFAVGRLQKIRMERRRRKCLCRFMGPSIENRRAEFGDTMLRRKTLRRSFG